VKFIAYLQKFLDSTDTTASLRNAAFALVMVAGVLYLGADLVNGIARRGVGITSDWNMAFGILTAAATGSKLIGQKLTKPSGDDKDVKE
jgi:hypothetical protein